MCLSEDVVDTLGLLPTPASAMRSGIEMTPQLGTRVPLLEGRVWRVAEGTGLVAVIRPALVEEHHRLGGAL